MFGLAFHLKKSSSFVSEEKYLQILKKCLIFEKLIFQKNFKILQNFMVKHIFERKNQKKKEIVLWTNES